VAARKTNITLDPAVFEEFCKYAGPLGIKISPWVCARMKEFIEEEKAKEELKNLKKRL